MELKKVVDGLAEKIDGRLLVFEDKIDWEEARKNFTWAVLFKLASEKPINKERFEEVLGRIWKLDYAAEFKKVEKDLMLVNFKSRRDQEKVVDGGPWSLDNSAVLMQQWEHGMMGDDFCNTKINIWIQLHRLPFELRKNNAARGLAGIVGVVKEQMISNMSSVNSYGESPKFRIELDTHKLIIPGFWLERKNRKHVWVQIKYVKLSSVCFNCGRLSHDMRQCPYGKQKDSAQFGKWLRAEDSTCYIPEWSESLVTDHSFETVAINGLEVTPEISVRRQSLLVNEPLLQEFSSSKDALFPTVEQQNIRFSNEPLNVDGLVCDMVQDLNPLENNNKKTYTPVTFDPGPGLGMIKRPRDSNKHEVGKVKLRKILKFRPLEETEDNVQQSLTDVFTRETDGSAEVAKQLCRKQC